MAELVTPSYGSPFHAGEIAVQERSGVREAIERVGRVVIRTFMLADHRELFARPPMVLVGSLDGARRPWASVLVGSPGFVHADDELRIDALPAPGDPLAGLLAVGVPLGLLGIELATRRRNRLNGTVTALDAAGFTVDVDQSFGNCPSVLVLPDFRGNFPFNTFGNVTVHPRAGMVFLDFESGDVLLLTGKAEIVWDGPELASFTGAERLLVITLESGLRHPDALPFEWSAPEYARQLR
jgi:predicted pyridoxine 5'-phosphate oxidase superfamily flavin-nucleotide-binding protein